MEEITPQERSALREYFRANAVPTQDQFWELIESFINNVEDGITKTRGSALGIRPASAPGSQVLELFKTQTGTTLAWTLEILPQVEGIGRAGLHFFQPGKTGTLYLQESDGAIGMGTLTPNARLQIISTTGDLWRHEDIYEGITLSLGGQSDGHPGSFKLHGSTLQDYALLRQASGALMIDSTNGEFYFNRDNSVRQAIMGVKPDTILHIMNGEQEEKIRLHAGGNSFFQGGHVGIGVTEPIAPLHLEGGGEASISERGSGALLIGNPDTVHLAVDSDAILAKSNGTTQGTLRLQPQGGLVQVGGDAHIQGALELDKDLTLNEDLIVKANLDVLGASSLHATTITGNLDVSGSSELHATKVTGRLDVVGDVKALNAEVNGTLTAIGASSLSSTTVNGPLNVSGASNLQNTDVNGNLAVSGQSNLHGTKVEGQLEVTNLSKLQGTLVNGDLHVNGQSNLHAIHADGTLEVTNQSNLRGTLVDGQLDVTAQSNLHGTHVDGILDVLGDANLRKTQINGHLDVSGPSNLHTTHVDGELNVLSNSNLHATHIDGTLAVLGQSTVHDTLVDGTLTVLGQSNLSGTSVNGGLGVIGQSNLQATIVNGSFDASGPSNLQNTAINGTLNVLQSSTLQEAHIAASLHVNGESHLLKTQIGGELSVSGPTSLAGTQIIGNLLVHNDLSANGHAQFNTLRVNHHISNGALLETLELIVQNNSSLGNAAAGNLDVHGVLHAHDTAQMQQVNAQSITTEHLTVNTQANLGTTMVNGHLTTNHLTVLDQANLGTTNINGTLNVSGAMNIPSLNVQGFFQADGAEVSNLQVLGSTNMGVLNVSQLTNVQNAQIFQLNSQEATVHNLHVTGLLDYPGMNVNGPANFMHLNIDGMLTFMQGAFRMEAAAGEMRIGSLGTPEVLKIMQDGQLRLNMDNLGGYPGYYNNGFSDLMMRGRMDIVDGTMDQYDPAMMYPGGNNGKAELVITGHRSRLAVASDIYPGPDLGSTIEFAAMDGGINSAFVFNIEQLRDNGSSYPYYGNPSMPGAKLGFYLWHRETEIDTPFGTFASASANDRIPFAIDGAKFRVGVGTSNPYTRLDVTGQSNMQALQMVVMEAEPGQLETEYSGNFNNFPSSNSVGGAAIGFASELNYGLPGFTYGPQQDGYVPGLYGKIGLSRNPLGPPPGFPVPPGMSESSGIELSAFHDLPIRMRISDQTMMSIERELQHARVEIGKEGAEPSRLIVHGDLEVKGNLIAPGAGTGAGPRPYGEFSVPMAGPGQEYVPVWYQDANPDGSLLEVEFFTADPTFPTVFQMRSFHFEAFPGGSNAGILMVQTLNNGTALGVADATLAPNGYRVIWVRSGRTYRWRANHPIDMYNEVPAPPIPLQPLSQPVIELQPGPMPGQQGYLFRQI